MGKNQWVSPDENGWKVHGEGKEIAKNQESELIIQGKKTYS